MIIQRIDAIGWQSSWWSSEGLVDDQRKPHLPTPHCAQCHSHRSSLHQLPTNSAQLGKTHNPNEANISLSVSINVAIEERTHQCQTWQAVDAPHAGERESGSQLAATAHQPENRVVEAEKAPTGSLPALTDNYGVQLSDLWSKLTSRC